MRERRGSTSTVEGLRKHPPWDKKARDDRVSPSSKLFEVRADQVVGESVRRDGWAMVGVVLVLVVLSRSTRQR
jgi:hypothetical protein